MGLGQDNIMSTPAVIQTNLGPAMLTSVASLPEDAATRKHGDGATLSASGSVVSATISNFIPYDTLTFTESGGTNSVSFTIRLRGSGRGVIEISGAGGVIDITGTIDGVTTAGGIQVESAAGVKQAADALGNGLYYIEV